MITHSQVGPTARHPVFFFEGIMKRKDPVTAYFFPAVRMFMSYMVLNKDLLGITAIRLRIGNYPRREQKRNETN